MFSRRYLELTKDAPLAVGESLLPPSPATPKRIKENAVVLLWMKQPWAPHPLRDVQGRLIRILSPGWMRGGSGPDFVDSVFQVDSGPAEKGDVEIHVRSSDWTRHKHHTDPVYNSVRLHVVMYCDVQSSARLTTSGGSPMELELNVAYPAWKETLRLTEDCNPAQAPDRLEAGGCARFFEKIGPQRTADILDAAGEGRLILKSEKLERDILAHSGEEALYLGLMEALGYSTFRPMFRKLAQALPLGFLRQAIEELDRQQRPKALGALFLGMAGLLPGIDVGAWDKETEEYLAEAKTSWGSMERRFGLAPVYGVDDWKLAGTRPANYPMGRLAGMAAFLSTNLGGNIETLFHRALCQFPIHGPRKEQAEWMTKVSGLFSTSAEDYWSTRHVVGGKRLPSPRALVSADRIGLFVINVAIPFFMARARGKNNREAEKMLRSIAHCLPRPGANAITKYMAGKLFQGKPPRGMLDAVRDQGLMQIYADFCLQNADVCKSCPLADYLGCLESGQG